MKLSSINDCNFTDYEIQNIVYNNEENEENTKYGLVFGAGIDAILKSRVYTAVMAYKTKKIQKIILSGDGSKNPDGNGLKETIRMIDLAIKLGVKEEDIIIEDKSNTTVENIEFSMNLIEPVSSIAIITSEFHLKRCMAILGKKYPYVKPILISAKDGFTDSDNWNLSGEGRKIAKYEAYSLVVLAKRNQMLDLDIEELEKTYQKK